MAGRKEQDYDWLDDPFNDAKNQKPRGGCTGPAVVALAIAVVLVCALGFFVVGSIGTLADVYGG